jgi:putative hemolysin
MKTLRVLITLGGLTLAGTSAYAGQGDCRHPDEPLAETKTFSQLTVTLSTKVVSSEIIAKDLSVNASATACGSAGSCDDFVISSSCVKGDGKLDCDAFLGLKKAAAQGLPHRKGGANPGALLCSDTAGGKAIVSLDEKGNQSGFCQFPDGTVVSMGSLRRAAATSSN